MTLVLSSDTSAAQGPAFEHIVVFGDSLSDMGNAGRFSNGPVWVEQVADKLKLTLVASERGGGNFAVGGARLDPRSGPESLRAQADRFLGMPPPAGRTLYVVWGGGNDVFAAMGQPEALTQLDAAATSLKSILVDLVEHGAVDLLVPNLPDVAMTPDIRAHGTNAVEEACRLTDAFNRAVERALTTLASSSSKSFSLYRLDVHDMAERAREHPASFGFSDIKTPCRGLPGCKGHLFWDDIHPTTEGHAQLAEAALRALMP